MRGYPLRFSGLLHVDKILSFALLAGSALSLVSCNRDSDDAIEVPAPSVEVISASPEIVPVTSKLSGRAVPIRTAEVRARVPGILVKRLFEEGADVKEGDVLFRIDDALYEAQLNNARALVVREESKLELAGSTLKRFRALIASDATSKNDLDVAIAAEKSAAADLAVAKAMLDTARLNAEYATVTAPISGRIGMAAVTEGALVGQGEPTLLATIRQLDPIYVVFNQSAAEIAGYRSAIESGDLQEIQRENVGVSAFIDSVKRYPHKGKLGFEDVAVDERTGQVALRAEFPNPGKGLLPGAYVRVEVEYAIDPAAITVPQYAVQYDSGGRGYVLIVNKDNIVDRRYVTFDRSTNDHWVIDSGLEKGDKVIVNGLQRSVVGLPAVPVEAGK